MERVDKLSSLMYCREQNVCKCIIWLDETASGSCVLPLFIQAGPFSQHPNSIFIAVFLGEYIVHYSQKTKQNTNMDNTLSLNL